MLKAEKSIKTKECMFCGKNKFVDGYPHKLGKKEICYDCLEELDRMLDSLNYGSES